jgi:hypothetical protein
MNISRRQFGALAGLSAVGLVLPGFAREKIKEKEIMRPVPPAPASSIRFEGVKSFPSFFSR